MEEKILAVKWDVKIKGAERSIQLFDEQGDEVEGKNARWEDDFDCYHNQLTSLAGAPSTVGGGFYCGYNKLTSLAGAPSTVGGDFYCYYNQLTSLAGAPETVGGCFDCANNQLTSLAGAPETVGGGFDCYHNQLTSLKGAPETVGGGFDCGSNQLTSLEGAPSTVGGGFYCTNNKLPGLAGAPETVGGDFDCYHNKLTSLKGAPLENVNMLSAFLKKGYLFADGVLTKIASKKKRGEVTVYKTSKIGTEKIVYVVQVGDVFSHGDTVKQAKADIIYKIGSRDTAFCSSWKLTDRKTKAELIAAYRAITGACFAGTRMFCEGRRLPEILTISEAIATTAGQYGAEKFKKFFTDKTMEALK